MVNQSVKHLLSAYSVPSTGLSEIIPAEEERPVKWRRQHANKFI